LATDTDIQYLRPFFKPVMVQARAAWSVVQVPATAAPRFALVRASTRYPVIGAPPGRTGAFHRVVTAPREDRAVTERGLLGRSTAAGGGGGGAGAWVAAPGSVT
jgi:hypothetical protein